MREPLSLPDPFRVIAHRGASGYAPENTRAAFQRAVDMGITEVETDVHLTRDGELVLLHDHTLERTTDGAGPPGEQSMDELRRLDAGGWFGAAFAGQRLIHLDDLLESFGDGLTYHVELKDRTQGIGAAAAAVVCRLGRQEQVWFSGFDADAELRAAKAAAPGTRSTVLVAPTLDAATAIDEAVRQGHEAVSLSARVVDEELVRAGQAAGLEVRCFGIRSRHDMERAAGTGCNGMTINWPDWLTDWIATQPT